MPLPYGSPRLSHAGLGAVLLLHVLLFWALLRMEVIVLPAPLAVLQVDLLTPPAPALPKPEIVPPKPRPVEKRPEPQPREIVPLALPAEAPAPPTAPAVEAPAVPPAPSFAPPAPPAPPAVPTQPRFDADYLDNPKPAYPSLSRRLGEEGRVVLRVRVSAAGLPLDVAVHAASGSPRLDRAALDTVRRWKFVPARLGSDAVAATVLVPIVFSLKD
jgi:protein TonB